MGRMVVVFCVMVFSPDCFVWLVGHSLRMPQILNITRFKVHIRKSEREYQSKAISPFLAVLERFFTEAVLVGRSARRSSSQGDSIGSDSAGAERVALVALGSRSRVVVSSQGVVPVSTASLSFPRCLDRSLSIARLRSSLVMPSKAAQI